ncbi:predicted protein [Histoplasma capsulatum var. duboisii H88]|uniref:Predicted protein n=1 Tax=Ajellomyces capsulatus (strain H88) TaxID=544711 RepID=F0UUD2_AJEC8|nr:predicted protein [Histoplasma capsulatum var. duboisii H88]
MRKAFDLSQSHAEIYHPAKTNTQMISLWRCGSVGWSLEAAAHGPSGSSADVGMQEPSAKISFWVFRIILRTNNFRAGCYFHAGATSVLGLLPCRTTSSHRHMVSAGNSQRNSMAVCLLSARRSSTTRLSTINDMLKQWKTILGP